MAELLQKLWENGKRFQQIMNQAKKSANIANTEPKQPSFFTETPNPEINIRRQLFESPVDNTKPEEDTPIKKLQELSSQKRTTTVIIEPTNQIMTPTFQQVKKPEPTLVPITHCPCCQHFNKTPKLGKENKIPNSNLSVPRSLNSSFLRKRHIIDDIEEDCSNEKPQ